VLLEAGDDVVWVLLWHKAHRHLAYCSLGDDTKACGPKPERDMVGMKLGSNKHRKLVLLTSLQFLASGTTWQSKATKHPLKVRRK